LLFDTNAGELLGIFPDAIIQHLRVGASSALAAKYLANNDADQLGVLGAGWQAQSHIPALDQIFDLETVTVYSPTPESRQSFAETMDEEIDAEVIPASEAKAVFKDADIVQCVTNSTEPVFDMDWVEDGTHVTIIRLAEAPKTFFDLDNLDAFATNWPPNVTQHEMYGNNLRENEKNAWVWNNYAIETDEPIPKLEWFDEVESLIEWDKISTLAEVIGGDVEGRTDHTEITGFFTCAVGVDFTAVAKLLYDVSEQKDLGRKLPAELFTQSHHP
jgi:ornithine cyclodeaminase/alanine dehydrogenase-like protein (mu-crystallin family)